MGAMMFSYMTSSTLMWVLNICHHDPLPAVIQRRVIGVMGTRLRRKDLTPSSVKCNTVNLVIFARF